MDEDKGFTVRDKRRVTPDGSEPAEDRKEEPSGKPEGAGPEPQTEPEYGGEVNFLTFILSISTSALVQLGELPDPISHEKKVDLMFARQTISIIEMLREKTKGNLTPEEEQLMEDVLYDLRLRYIKAT
jgi:hypothetical protein